MLEYRSPSDTVFTVRNVTVKFGRGVISEIGYEVKRLGANSVLVVTDENIRKNTPIVETCLTYLSKEGVKAEVFDGTPIEPVDTGVLKAIDFARGKEFEAIIGLGGGSSIDMAKMINLYTSCPADLYDYIAPPTGKGLAPTGPLRPLIAVPTTAGTGSENTPVAVLDLTKEKLKVGISHPSLVPDLALLDPTLTITLSPFYTASTGLDTLLHSIEAYTSIPYYARPRPESPDKRPVYIGSNPVSDLFVEESIKLVAKYLRRAYFNPHDLEAREKMLLATHLGGAFGNAGVHVPHALAYPIAGRNHELPHGLCVALTGVKAIEFLAPAAPEKFARVAAWLGEETEGLSLHDAALRAKEGLRRLMRDLNIAKGLLHVGFDESDVDELAEAAMKVQRLLSMSPRPVTLEDAREIYRGSLENW
ncbi:MAG: iron-containing alcohol dehydrogenase [Deltaproteobacteria bacterium]|nr:MAG: iron-containing alcohol dehydrogenase [Deltaproteobacteria bacterium]